MNNELLVQPCFKKWGSNKTYSSLDIFSKTFIGGNGVHSVKEGDLYIDFLISNENTMHKKKLTPVFFNAAVSDREYTRPPYFSGLGYSSKFCTFSIAFSDPSLYISKDIKIAWFAGSKYQNTQRAILIILKILHDYYKTEFVTVGGSAGGFAAIYYGLTSSSVKSIFAFNPQTSIKLFDKNIVYNYYNMCYNIALDKVNNYLIDTLSNHTYDLKKLLKTYEGLKNLVYFVNVSDHSHLNKHLKHIENDLPDSTLLFQGNWGVGHIPPPNSLVYKVIQLLSHNGENVIDLIDNTIKHEHKDIIVNEKKLNPENCFNSIFLTNINFSLGKISVSLEIIDTEFQDIELNFAFYLLVDSKVMEKKMYTNSNSVEFNSHNIHANSKYSVIYYVRDKLGTTLSKRIDYKLELIAK